MLVIALPAESVPAGPLRARSAPSGVTAPLRERTAGTFEFSAAEAPGPFLTVLDGDRTVATLPVPPPGDPEYAWPADLSATPVEPPPPAERLRAPWALLSAAAWAAALLLRRRFA
jgi:hypothetical protein